MNENKPALSVNGISKTYAEVQAGREMSFEVGHGEVFGLLGPNGGYLLSSFTEEKSNRIMEILLVSLRPRQLLAGKLIGLAGLTLLQYVAWLLVSGLIFLLVGSGGAGSLGALSG